MSAQAETASTKRSYLTVLLRALAGAPHETMGDRRRIYDSAQRYLLRFFDSQDPPMDEDTREIEIRILRQTIRLLELDIRAGVDVWAPNYRPAELDAILENLERSRRVRLDRKRGIVERAQATAGAADPTSPADTATVDRLRQALASNAHDDSFTLAARKETELSDADVLDMLQAMRELGIIK